MSNRNTELSYESLSQALDFFWRERVKTLHTALPAHVVAYTPADKRAVVQPAIDLVMTDGARIPRAAIANVPVLHPAGGGYVVHLPLAPGDAVMLLCSERGLSGFKEAFQRVAPDKGVIMGESDAVAIPGFGALAITPAGPGLVAQTEDGGSYVQINAGAIKIKGESVTIETGSFQVNASGSVDIDSGGGNITLDSSGDTLIVR